MSAGKILAILLSVSALTACDTVALLRDRNVTSLSEKNTTRQEVNRRFGSPVATLDTVNGQAVCHEYLYTPSNGSQTRIWVNFRKSDDRVIAFGVDRTCEKAQEAGHLNSLERASASGK